MSAAVTIFGIFMLSVVEISHCSDASIYVPGPLCPVAQQSALRLRGGNNANDQENRLAEMIEAKKAYERSVAAVKELLSAGIITQAEADREMALANDTLAKIKAGNIKDIYKRGGCLPLEALLAKKRAKDSAQQTPKPSADLFGMSAPVEAPMTKSRAQVMLEEASAKGDSVAMQKAVDVLKEFEEKEKVRKATLNPENWGGKTLGRTHLEHELQEAIQNGDSATVEKLVAELKSMDNAEEEEMCSFSG